MVKRREGQIMKEQLTARAPFLTRRFKLSGGMSAMTLGELQGPAKQRPKYTSALCKGEHRWLLGRHTMRCLRCGLEDAR